MYQFTGFLYRNIVKKILFLFSADKVHEFFLRNGNTIGKSKIIRKIIEKSWSYKNESLEQTLCNLNFINPIGLSAGFDYDADLVEILPSIGFGFHTIGTVTHEPYMGNPPPMLGRLPKSKALLVNKGFKNKGIKEVLKKLDQNKTKTLRGVSIGATNKVYQDFTAMLTDLILGFVEAETFNNFDYYELNISCPNVTNINNISNLISSPVGLNQTLENLNKLQLKRPVFIKMPLERTEAELKELMDVASQYQFIKGLIFSNLAKDRTNPIFNKNEIAKAGKGNFSGKPVENQSNEALRFAYRQYHDRFVLVGVGGVFTAEDAYLKIQYGASLVQLITGMIFMGPQQIGTINSGLVELLKKDGYKNIKEAVGKNA
ncbi:MAG: quinone-dependent dihydroorotate dehydrogenase [bacterium]|nr:quinone-dependent dihydroorotate dehydrogenase [bacterium]